MSKDKIFISLIILIILSLSLGTFIGGRKEVSVTENRKLEYFPKFSRESFFNNSFQRGIESALVDQIPIGEEFKIKYNSLRNKNLNSVVSALKTFESDRKYTSIIETDRDIVVDNSIPEDFKFELEITPKGNSVFEIDQTNHLIYPQKNLMDSRKLLKSKADNYNQLVKDYPEISFHCNYIETDEDIDFINGNINHSLIKEFHKYLDPTIKKSALYLNRPSEFQKYFYKTDHHWNARGQLEGYKTIMKNLKGPDVELLDINEIPIKGAKYNGSKSREIYDYKIYDEFEVLRADLPNHQTYINNQKAPYGYKEDFIKGNFKKEKGKNYYGDANGGDFGIIKYEFNTPNEQNLLVFVDSFSNPIKEFIASHYNNTYFIDLRDYENVYGKKFDFGDFVKANNINQVLYTGYILSFANDVFLVTD